MKTMKKVTALTVAAALAVGAMSVGAFAEDSNAMYLKSENASVGDTVSVSVIVDSLDGVGAVSFFLNYNSEELELQSETLKVGDAVSNWITGDESGFNLNEKGKIGFAYVTMGKGFSGLGTEIMSASFKVLKPNSEITLSNVVINADDIDSTDTTDEYAIFDTIINCSHKNADKKTTPSTCTVKGSETTVCKDCGETVDTKELPLADHTWDNGTETKAPTCTEKGEVTYTCTVCKETKTEATDAKGHSYDEGTVVKEATCTEAGSKVFKCKDCEDEYTEDIPAAGHSYGEWTKGEEEGTEQRVCEVCQNVETRTVPDTGDDNPTTDESKPATDDSASGSTTDPTPDKNNADTGVGGIAAVASLAAISAAAVIVSKKRK